MFERGSKSFDFRRSVGRRVRLVRDLAGAGRRVRTEEGMATAHHSGFHDDPDFLRCYARAVKAGGYDYNIRYRVHQALWCARMAEAAEGDFVELGTGKGFVMSALLESGVTRPVHLFDTFLSRRLNGSGQQTGEIAPNYAQSLDEVRANFAEWPNVTLHPGNIYDTLPKASIDSVAFLHVDMNHADPEEFGIRQLWPRMSKGAAMLLDDYAYVGYERQLAVANSLSRELGFNILSTPTGQGIVIKV